MAKNALPPWTAGPAELLTHGLDLLQDEHLVSHRLAMICVDEAVRLIVRTYLELPAANTGLHIGRDVRQECSESVVRLLDVLEQARPEPLVGVDIGELEWCHAIRQGLYHQGRGLNVDRAAVEVYAVLANALFESLFGFPLVRLKDFGIKLLADFFDAWTSLDRVLQRRLSQSASGQIQLDPIRHLHAEGAVSRAELSEIDQLRTIRYEIVHGLAHHDSVLKASLIDKLHELVRQIGEHVHA